MRPSKCKHGTQTSDTHQKLTREQGPHEQQALISELSIQSLSAIKCIANLQPETFI